MSFPGYPEYKESGVAWVGEAPKHWRNVPFFSLLRERSESNKGLKNSNLLSLSYGRIIQKDINTLDGLLPASFETYQIIYPRDIVFRLTDLQNDKRSLRSAIVLEKGIITSAYLCVECVSVNPHFAKHLFRAYDLLKVFYSMGGGLRQSMKFTDMKWMPILLPSAKEQTQIARFLDHETARIDALIEEQQRLIELLKEKRQAVISHAVTKGLDPTVPMKDSGVEWLGEVPEHWRVSKLAHYATVLTGFPFPSASFSHNESDVRLLRGVNIGVGLLKWDDTVYWQLNEGDTLSSYLMKEGQIVLGMDRPWIGEGIRIARVSRKDMPCLLLQRVAALTPNEELDDDYLYCLLASEIFKAYIEPDLTGVSVPHISPEQVLSFQVPIPDKIEQRKIADFIRQQLDRMSALFMQATESIKLLQERRSALISAAVTGKIDVRDWQPDQPTSSNTERDYAMVAESSADYR